jgi:hypothetical protein
MQFSTFEEIASNNKKEWEKMQKKVVSGKDPFPNVKSQNSKEENLFKDIPLNIELLAKDFERNYFFDNPFIYTTYISKSYHIEISGGKADFEKKVFDPVQINTIDDFQNLSTSEFKSKVNTREDRLDLIPKFSVDFDVEGNVYYTLKFAYYSSSTKQHKSEIVDLGFSMITIEEQEFAIELSTKRIQDFKGFYIQSGFRNWDAIEKYIALQFKKQIDKANDKQLAVLIEQAPASIFRSIIMTDNNGKDDPSILWNNLVRLINFDNNSILQDAGNSILRIMLCCNNQVFLYNKFHENQALVKKAYNVLQGKFKYQGIEYSKTYLFAMQFIAGGIGSKNNTVINQTFFFSKEQRVDSNIFQFFDQEDDKIFLKQQKVKEERTTVVVGRDDHLEEKVTRSFEDENEGANYSPLDFVYLSMPNEKGNSNETLLVPAILIKAIADDEEWDRIVEKGIKIVIALVVITLSILSIYGGAAGLILAADIVFISSSATEIITLLGVPDGPDKDWALENLDKLTLYSTSAMLLPGFAKAVLSNGSRLLSHFATTTLNANRPLRDLLMRCITKAVLEVEIANALPSTFRYIEPISHQVSFCSELMLERLYSQSAYFMEYEVKDGAKKLSLIYNGEAVISGSEKEIKGLLKEFEGINGDELGEALEDFDIIKNKYPLEALPNDGIVIEYSVSKDGLYSNSKGGLLNKVEYNFVITKDYKLILGDKHHFLSGAKDVRAAGSIVFGKGRITKFNNLSGHFKPTVEEAMRYERIFKNAGIKIRRALFEVYEFILNTEGYIKDKKLVKTIEIKIN